MIPGALKKADNAAKVSRICGQDNLVTAGGTTSATVCSKKYPFMLHFLTDDVEAAEGTTEVSFKNKGINLLFEQTSC